MLQLRGIKKTFGKHHIFTIDELNLPPGIYWLKGMNGAGKSTLLKIIAGQLPFAGEILLNEKISLRKNPVTYRQLINHAEAEPAFPSFLAGSELVSFVQAIKNGNERQIATIKETLQIANYIENPTGSYSSGMLKKLSLLIAFTGHPQWILLDEPLTTLDAVSQKKLCALIVQLRKENTSFIIISHQNIEHADICFDQTFILESGQLRAVQSFA
jgi:ABC-2 type transport system ATP-binding protein